MTDKQERDEHPAYGTIGFYRTTGDPGKMFGSALPQHGHFIVMSVKRAVRYHDLSSDWIHGTGEELINIWLSAVQFAELLTTMNVGDGVPCTIRRFNGEGMPAMPLDDRTEAEKIHTDFDAKVQEFSDKLSAKTDELREQLLAKDTLKMDQRKAIANHLEWIRREVSANLPFVQRSFQEAVEKTTVHAKAELDAMVTHVVQQTGLETLAGGTLAALPARKDDDEPGK